MSGAILVAKATGPMLADPRDLDWKKINPYRRLTPLAHTLQEAV